MHQHDAEVQRAQHGDVDQQVGEILIRHKGAWLEGRHAVSERRLWQARPTQPKDHLFLYDLTSPDASGEGDYNALAAWGYNRDHKQGKKQVVVGQLTDSQGEPVSSQGFGRKSRWNFRLKMGPGWGEYPIPSGRRLALTWGRALCSTREIP